MLQARKYMVVKRFDGLPKGSDFALVTVSLPPVQDGAILVRTEWISVDPYLRLHQSEMSIPYDQFSYQVGVVEESQNPEYPVGTRVVSHRGWTDYYVHYFDEVTHPNYASLYKLPDLQGLPKSLGIGAVGMPGATAYFGLLDICQPKSGETVVVTGAAGAVGSLVGQIAKIRGCRVIGFAGSDEKVEWLENELGFDKAYNYKEIDAVTALSEAAPNGVDCFFDNVGGALFSNIVSAMNPYGRVAVCGSIAYYNEDVGSRIPVPDIQPVISTKRLKVEGLSSTQWLERWPEAFAEMIEWIRTGQLKANEHVTEGFENVIEAFIGVLLGENMGKAVVKV